MTLKTLAKYLFLIDREAIREIAACRHAVWLGLIFVLSAGFAREYDGEDLLAEPWHLLIPLAASLGTSFLLFGLVWLINHGWRREELPFVESYRSFLSLYWMTAPLAWIYAIPVERFLSPAEAVRANLWFLALVAAWRVLLITRGVSTLFSTSAGRAVFPVFLFADSLVVVILFLTPLPVFSIMGGIRLSESEEIIQNTAFWVGFIGILSWPVWLIGTLVVGARPLEPRSPSETPTASPKSVSRPLWGLGIVSVAGWLLILPFTQPEQQRRRDVEELLYAGEIEQALELMSAHDRSDFPPHWDPPPRVGYGESRPELRKVLETLIAIKAKPWVQVMYWEKFGAEIGSYWWDLTKEEWDRHLAILEQLPKGSPILKEHRVALQTFLTKDSPLTDTQKDRLRELVGERQEEHNEEKSPTEGDQVEASASDEKSAPREHAP